MEHKIKLKPFQVPNFVTAEMPARLRQDGIQQPPCFPIHELSDETLEAMCKEFRAELFAKKAAAIGQSQQGSK